LGSHSGAILSEEILPRNEIDIKELRYKRMSVCDVKVNLFSGRFSGVRSGKMLVNPKLWNQFSSAERSTMLDLVANAQPDTDETRNLYTSVDSRVSLEEIGDRTFDANLLKLKGAAPLLDCAGNPTSYTGIAGHVKVLIEPRQDGWLGSRSNDQTVPFGGNIFRLAEQEYRFTLLGATTFAEAALAYGQFDTMTYPRNDGLNPLGFNLELLSFDEDLRLATLVHDFPIDCDFLERNGRFAVAWQVLLSACVQYGVLVRDFLDRGLIHGHPSLGNVGVRNFSSFIPQLTLRDFETVKQVALMDYNERYLRVFREIFYILSRMAFNGPLLAPVDRLYLTPAVFSGLFSAEGNLGEFHPFDSVFVKYEAPTPFEITLKAVHDQFVLMKAKAGCRFQPRVLLRDLHNPFADFIDAFCARYAERNDFPEYRFCEEITEVGDLAA
jgi:hypothetical protein